MKTPRPEKTTAELLAERTAQRDRLEAKCGNLLLRLANAKLTNTRLRRDLRASKVRHA